MFGWVTDGKDHKRLLGGWPAQQGVQELHRIGRMDQRREAGMMQGHQEKTGRNTDAFWNVVVLESRAVVKATPPLCKNNNEPRCYVQVGL